MKTSLNVNINRSKYSSPDKCRLHRGQRLEPEGQNTPERSDGESEEPQVYLQDSRKFYTWGQVRTWRCHQQALLQSWQDTDAQVKKCGRHWDSVLDRAKTMVTKSEDQKRPHHENHIPEDALNFTYPNKARRQLSQEGRDQGYWLSPALT